MASTMTSPRLATITLVRDGADILVPFIEHHLPLVDRAFVIDHLSVDGTREWLGRRAREDVAGRLEVLHYDQPAYYQSHLSDLLAREAFADGADWVLFLDVDEFLAFECRAALESALAPIAGGLAKFVWSHLIPTVMSDQGPFDVTQELRTTPTQRRAGRSKVAIHRSFAARHPGFRVDGGNHGVRATPGGRSLRGEHAGTLLHLPIRSRAQLDHKVAVRMASFRATEASEHGIAPHMLRLAATLERVQRDDPVEGDRELLQLAVLEYEGDDALSDGLDPSQQETVLLPLSVRAAAERALRDAASGFGVDDPSINRTQMEQAQHCGPLGQWRAHRSGQSVRVDPTPMGRVTDLLLEMRRSLFPRAVLRRIIVRGVRGVRRIRAGDRPAS